ncbi:LLM class flavin-dependent oxidoreductase [Amycolatopsis sp.]|uniref:LLM class flavin-dependent oxidoreductase n=1 Tax=Amycolatopsis sp. TaxID=37632 RepID=UPI0039C8A324
MDDIVALWRTLWTGGKSFHGKELHYDTLPVPPPHRVGGPPVWLAGFTPKALERAGRLYDGWLPYPPDPADFATGLATVQANSQADKPVTPGLFATVFIGENGRRALADYCLAYYGAPLEFVETIQVFITGSRAEVAAGLRRYVDAGARHVLVRPATLVPEVFAGQVSQVAAMIVDSASGLS